MPLPQKKLAVIKVRLEPHQKHTLDQLATIGQATVSALIRQAIDEYLTKPQVRAILKTTLLAYCLALFFMID